jgi:cysteine desulfurase
VAEAVRLPTEQPEALRNRPAYLDYNATTPVDPRAAEAALPYLTREFGNPSSAHLYGLEPREAVGRARDETVGLLGGSRPR